MKRPALMTAGLLMSAAIVAGCTDTTRSKIERLATDKPSSIRCMSFGEVLYQGRSKGKTEFDETGKLAFTDAATNQLTTVEGDCLVVSDR